MRGAVKRFGDRTADRHCRDLDVGARENIRAAGTERIGQDHGRVDQLDRAEPLELRLDHRLRVGRSGHARMYGQTWQRLQETALYEDPAAVHNLRLHADLHFVPRSAQRKRIADVLELVQLTDRAGSRVKTFSGGMKRRLALARALSHGPPSSFSTSRPWRGCPESPSPVGPGPAVARCRCDDRDHHELPRGSRPPLRPYCDHRPWPTDGTGVTGRVAHHHRHCGGQSRSGTAPARNAP